jgi:hypothetical protein
MQNNGDNYLILCGNWENSFQIISLSDGRIMQSIRQHKDVVSCVAGTRDILVSLCFFLNKLCSSRTIVRFWIISKNSSWSAKYPTPSVHI